MKIICIGRNYADHAAEMNAEVPKEPMFFMKPDTALNRDFEFYIPDFTNDMHYELEVVVKISKAGKSIEPEFAANYYEEISLGIDFTARDLQKKCKEQGTPWEIAKGFDNAAFIAPIFFSKSDFNLHELGFQLYKNNALVQDGNTKDMIFSVNELICHVSKYITLKPGDLLYTGTPKGVGSVLNGDVLTGKLNGKDLFKLRIK